MLQAILKEEHPDFHKDIYRLLAAAFSDVADKVIVVEVQDLLLEKKFQPPSITKDPGWSPDMHSRSYCAFKCEHEMRTQGSESLSVHCRLSAE